MKTGDAGQISCEQARRADWELQRLDEMLSLMHCPYYKAKLSSYLYRRTKDPQYRILMTAVNIELVRCRQRHKGSYCLFRHRFKLGLTPADRAYLSTAHRPAKD